MTDGVAELLPGMHDELVRWVRRNAGRLLRRETEDDVVQGIHARALEHGRDARFASRKAFLAWMYRVAASQVADRAAYWAALRRAPDRLLRLTRSGSETTDPRAVRETGRDATGPGTRAGRDEDSRRAARALGMLLPRDRLLVEWHVAEVPAEDQAARLGVAPAALRQARKRALERLRKTFQALEGPRRPRRPG